MKSATLYFNPSCSKSRKALSLLEEHQVTANIIEYLKQTPSAQELTQLINTLAIQTIELVRRDEPIWKELISQNENPSDEQIIDWMVQHPILIQRPIVVNGDQAVIARPPEKLLEIL